MAGFVQDTDKAAWVAEDTDTQAQAGAILCLFRDLDSKSSPTMNRDFFARIREYLPADARVTEVFNLWIHPDYRRQGLATRLKRHLEKESRSRAMRMVYTHTEASNHHAIELNRKLGYREIRRGPIWDEVVRVSLVKDLPWSSSYSSAASRLRSASTASSVSSALDTESSASSRVIDSKSP